MTSYETRLIALRQLAEDIAEPRLHATLPRLFLYTDPDRTPRPEEIAAHMPSGSGIVYRHFGAADRFQKAQMLKRIARERGLILMIGSDPELAERIDADGVHLSQARLHSVRDLRAAHQDWLITAACHDQNAVKEAQMFVGLDAIVVSPVFPSRSPSALGVSPLGVSRFQVLASKSALPVIALGGVNTATAHELKGSGAYGFAAINAFIETNVEGLA